MYSGRHDLFHVRPLWIPALQYDAQHDIAFAENPRDALFIHDKYTADLGGSHKLDGLHDSSCPRYSQNRPADDGHSVPSFLRGTSIQEEPDGRNTERYSIEHGTHVAVRIMEVEHATKIWKVCPKERRTRDAQTK